MFVDRKSRVEQDSRRSNKPHSLSAEKKEKLYSERAYVQIEGNLKQGSKGVQIINTQGYQLPENGDFRIHIVYIPKYKKNSAN